MCVYFGGLECVRPEQPSSQQQQNGSSSKQQQGIIIPQDQGRRQMLPGIGTLRGERTPGF